MTKISIIIPVYNGEKYIEKCLDSIKNQTFKDYEVLIINDGSKDNTKNLIEKYLNDKRFKLFNRTNHGIGVSRNFGLDESSGEYICFIDSDDYVDKKYLEKLYNKISKENLDIVVCNYIELNEESNIEKKVKIKAFDNTTIDKNPELLLSINKSPWNKIYRKSILENIKFPTDLKYEDTEFLCKALYNSKIGYVDEYLNYYVIHTNSETTTMDKRVFDILNIIDNIRKFYENSNDYIKEYIDKMSLQILTTYTIQQRYQKDKKLAKEFINRSFNYMEKNISNFKKNSYFKDRGIKGIIEKNKVLTLIYCILYIK